jgi:hypothetical protein
MAEFTAPSPNQRPQLLSRQSRRRHRLTVSFFVVWEENFCNKYGNKQLFFCFKPDRTLDTKITQLHF